MILFNVVSSCFEVFHKIMLHIIGNIRAHYSTGVSIPSLRKWKRSYHFDGNGRKFRSLLEIASSNLSLPSFLLMQITEVLVERR